MTGEATGPVTPTKAHVSKGYKWRLGVIALACLAFAAWFFYDGSVKYPKQKAIHDEYVRLQNSANEDPAWNQKWIELATANGWSIDVPTPRSDMDIFTQYLMGALVLPIGLLFAYSFLRWQFRWVGMDEAGLRTNAGEQVPWSAIRGLDDARWKSKGISHVRYADAGGAERRLLLDDWKFERVPTTQIHDAVARRLGLEVASSAQDVAGVPDEASRQEQSTGAAS